jgi:thiol-disulfide isomerase/thioredoxin
MRIQVIGTLLALVVLAVASCSRAESPAAANLPAEQTPTAQSTAPEPAEEARPTAAAEETEQDTQTDTASNSETAAEENAQDGDAETLDRPAWQQLPLVNAQTGESFTLADFAGKTVYVEPFATWCSNCRRQMGNVNEARAAFGDDVVFVALSVEPNISNEALASYAEQQGFNFIFAAMSPEMLRETVAIFGQTLSNPPATPHFIIRADGSTTDLFTGISDTESVAELIRAEQS